MARSQDPRADKVQSVLLVDTVKGTSHLLSINGDDLSLAGITHGFVPLDEAAIEQLRIEQGEYLRKSVVRWSEIVDSKMFREPGRSDASKILPLYHIT